MHYASAAAFSVIKVQHLALPLLKLYWHRVNFQILSSLHFKYFQIKVSEYFSPSPNTASFGSFVFQLPGHFIYVKHQQGLLISLGGKKKKSQQTKVLNPQLKKRYIFHFNSQTFFTYMFASSSETNRHLPALNGAGVCVCS